MTINDNTLNAYKFGSKVYGTDDEHSDDDYIHIVKDYVQSDDINTHVFTVPQFQTLVDNHDIQALECLFLPKQHKLKETYGLTFKLDKHKLRPAISTVVSHSWVKGKKKLTTMADYDKRAAIKSVFHSFRILDYGIQIAQHGRIVNYASCNWIYEDLKKLADRLENVDLWNSIDTHYRSLHNQKNRLFKELAPKDPLEVDKRSKLLTILTKHGVQRNSELINELLTLF